ncbi:fibronectin type III domain-containing protein [Candidatus Uhrbacteria bacterium]|nr:fibronectin type III domain-containing protein [Candidatus Uhrbacteria bacterium]
MNFIPLTLAGALIVTSFSFKLPWNWNVNTDAQGQQTATVTVAANANTNDKKGNGNGNANGQQKPMPWGIFKKLLTAANDVTAPILRDIRVKAESEGSAKIEWKTNEKTSGEVRYGLTANYGLMNTDNGKMKKSHSVKLSNLSANTTYHIQVVSKDAAGNVATSADMTVTTKPAEPREDDDEEDEDRDTIAPLLFNLSVNGETRDSAVVRWATNEKTTSQVHYGLTASYGQSTSVDTDLTTNHEVRLIGLTANTTYHFKVESKDAAGNVSASGDVTLTTRAAPDITAPIISDVNVSATTDHSATIQWTSNEGATSQVLYGTTASYGSSTTIDSSLTTSHSVALSGLAANTTYHYQVKSVDGSGNISTSADATFTTAGDATAPTISNLVVTNVARTTAIVRWTTSEPATSKVSYSAGSSFNADTAFSLSSSALLGNHSMLIVGLSANTTYTLKVDSVDASGNAAASAQLTFTTR